MEPRYIVVTTANGHLEAEMLKAFLEAAGIPAFIAQESAGIAYGLSIGSLGEADILVSEENEEEALQLLAAMEKGDLEQPGGSDTETGNDEGGAEPG